MLDEASLARRQAADLITDREKKEGVWVIARTATALVFGVWCHFVHTYYRDRYLSNLYRDVFSFYTFIMLDLVLIFISIKHRKIIDENIEKAI